MPGLEVDMTTTNLKQEICDRLDSLPSEDQRKVLALARALDKSRPAGVSGKALLRFIGSIDETDLDIMRRTIEEDCERVDENEW